MQSEAAALRKKEEEEGSEGDEGEDDDNDEEGDEEQEGDGCEQTAESEIHEGPFWFRLVEQG